MITVKRGLNVISTLLVTLFLFGCAASFRGNELTQVTEFPPQYKTAAQEVKPSVYLDISWHTKMWPFQEKSGYIGSFVRDVIAVTQESELFSDISTAIL